MPSEPDLFRQSQLSPGDGECPPATLHGRRKTTPVWDARSRKPRTVRGRRNEAEIGSGHFPSRRGIVTTCNGSDEASGHNAARRTEPIPSAYSQ